MVSIVVPVYNVEKYLKQCVDSILAQTYTDYEIILVNDGSVDESGAICDRYGENPNIKVIHKKNAGLGMARNTGIEVARGEYITFLDADDYWAPTALENLMKGINKYSADTAIGGYSRITNSGKILFEEKPIAEVYKSANDVKKLFFPKLMGSAPTKKDSFRPSVWNAVYNMDIIKNNDVKFPSEREFIAEDIIFNVQYYKYSKRVCVVESASYFYRVTPGSLTQKYKSDRFEKVVYLYQEVMKRLEEQEHDEVCLLRAKRQFFVYIRNCIKQENVHVSKLNLREAIDNIEKICNNAFTHECINTYPVKKLGILQELFLVLVKYKVAIILYVLLCRDKQRNGGRA